jgi:putative transposase
MVRAGVVTHPSEWKWSGYHEIQQPKERYRLVDNKMLQKLLHVNSQTALAAAHRGWISSQLKRAPEREERYSKSIAIVETVQAKMGIKAIGRRRRESRRDAYELRETVERYGHENS